MDRVLRIKPVAQNQMKAKLKKKTAANSKPTNPRSKNLVLQSKSQKNVKSNKPTQEEPVQTLSARNICFDSNTYLADNRFLIENKDDILGAGGFGKVYKGKVLSTDGTCAIKFIYSNKFNRYELLIMAKTSHETGFPRLMWYGQVGPLEMLVMERLGPSIGSKLKQYGAFSARTVLKLAVQVITRLETLHKYGFVHRDLNFNNMLLGVGGAKDSVYLIDFGLSLNLATQDVINFPTALKMKTARHVRGTPVFVSRYAHLCRPVTKTDDLVSLGYLLLKLVKGTLPWEGIENSVDATIIKVGISAAELCKGLPNEFCSYFDYLFSTFSQLPDFEPDYKYLKRCFFSLAKRCKIIINGPYDWVNHEGGCQDLSKWFRSGKPM